MEDAVADAQPAGAIDRVGRRQARLEERHRDHRLDRRSGRIKALQRLVAQRHVIVARQQVPLVMADPAGKAVGIERRHRRQRQDIAGQAVEDDDRTRFAPQPPRRIGLKIGVERQLERTSRDVTGGRQFAHHLAARGDLDALGARLAAQILLELLFEPVLADLETRRDQQRVLGLLELLGRSNADIAHQMADRRAARVIAGKAA